MKRVAVAVGEKFDDRHAVPHDDVAVPQDWHLAERWSELVPFAALLPVGIEHRDDQFLEFFAALLAGEPAAHRPARIGAIADDQLEQARSPRTSRLRGSPPEDRRCRYPFRSTW